MDVNIATRNCELMNLHKICLLIPTYNNAQVLAQVIDSVLPYCNHIVVVNDGSTDDTKSILHSYGDSIAVVGYPQNKGKGFALRVGFEWARQHHYNAVITMDSDGQHLATDIPLLVKCYIEHTISIVLGCRSLHADNMPSKNTFANKFSNFWFMVQTAMHVNDTQTGFRIYPLKHMGSIRPYCHRYEAELELLVRSAWRNIPIVETPIHVYYPPKEQRITHFRPTIDFIRISLLNVALCICAIVYGYPSRVIRALINQSK